MRVFNEFSFSSKYSFKYLIEKKIIESNFNDLLRSNRQPHLCLINQTITHNSFSCFTVLYSEYKELHELLFFREVPDVAAVASII